MPSASEKTVVRARVVPNTVRFTQWPLRDEPARSITIVTAVSLLAAISGWVAERFTVGLFLWIVLNVTLIRLWIPTYYELGSKGIIFSRLGRRRRIAWSDFSQFQVQSDGVWLVTDAVPYPALTGLRSLFLRFGDRREELLTVVDFYFNGVAGKQASSRSPSTTTGRDAAPKSTESMRQEDVP